MSQDFWWNIWVVVDDMDSDLIWCVKCFNCDCGIGKINCVFDNVFKFEYNFRLV